MLEFYSSSKILLYIKELQEGKVVFIDLHPSDICNHRCVWCRYERSSDQLSWDQLMGLINKYPEVKGIVVGGGGEPLTNKNIPEFIRECGRRGIATGVYTNGSLLAADSIDAIGNNCRFCRISLDAAKRETYSRLHRCSQDDFDRVLQNIRSLRDTGLRELGLSYLVVSRNVEEIPLLADLDIPIDYVHFKPLIQGISEGTRTRAVETIEDLSRRAHFRVKYDRISRGDLMCNHRVACKITRITRLVAASGKEYTCCEHDGEEEFEIRRWDGSTARCRTCRFNGYNEVIHAYECNSIAKEFL